MAVYWSRTHPGTGVVAAGFRDAHAKMIDDESRADVARAADDWWGDVDQMSDDDRTPDRVLAAAVYAAESRGVGLPVVRGLAAHVGAAPVAQAQEEGWSFPHLYDDFKAAASAAQKEADATRTTTAVLVVAALATLAFIAYNVTKEGGKTARSAQFGKSTRVAARAAAPLARLR